MEDKITKIQHTILIFGGLLIFVRHYISRVIRGVEDGKMSEHNEISSTDMGVSRSNEEKHIISQTCEKPQRLEPSTGGPNVVVKRERLFNLLQEEHLKERLIARGIGDDAVAVSAGVFRLYGGEKIPEVKPLELENDDPTSLGIVTFR
jgi:hypothetical protein